MKRLQAKPRGAKAKERLKKEKLKPKMRLQRFNSFKQLKGIIETPAEIKSHRQYFSLLSKYYGLRKRLLLNQYGPFHREMKRVGFSCKQNTMYIAYYNAQQNYRPKNQYLGSFKNY